MFYYFTFVFIYFLTTYVIFVKVRQSPRRRFEHVMAFFRHLRAIGNARCNAKGKILHAKMETKGLLLYDIYTYNNLIQMYVKCRNIEDARRLFDRMPMKNVVSFTTLMSGYLKLKFPEETLDCFRSMVSGRYNDCASLPNHLTLVTVVSACTVIGAAKAGKEIHGWVVKAGSMVCAVNNSLVNFYAKCGLLSTARRVFDRITCPNVVSFGSILSGYSQSGRYGEALHLFRDAMNADVDINEFLLAGALGACSSLGDSSSFNGKQVHCVATKIGFLNDKYVEAGLVDLYLKRRELISAHMVAETTVSNVVSWTMLIGGFAQEGDPKTALNIFSKMLVRGNEINELTFSSAMIACSKSADIIGGEQIRSVIVKSGHEASTVNVIIDFYAKCGAMEESAKVFEEMHKVRDQVSWNTLIAGYIAHKNSESAVEVIQRMSFRPDHYTYSSILSLCGDFPAPSWGVETHAHMLKHGYEDHVFVGSSLVDMYAKCGRPETARRVFERMSVKNVVSWNSMLVGYAQHGLATEALEIFHAMRSHCIKPNSSTFVGVLSACAHKGLVEEGIAYFNSMSIDHSLVPCIEHYTCMVDLLSRAGHINRAYDVIKSMPVQPNEVIWRSFLSGCRTHGDVEMGIHAAKWILKLRPNDASTVTLLSGVLAESEMWDQKAQLRNSMIGSQKKVSGRSWIE